MRTHLGVIRLIPLHRHGEVVEEEEGDSKAGMYVSCDLKVQRLMSPVRLRKEAEAAEAVVSLCLYSKA